MKNNWKIIVTIIATSLIIALIVGIGVSSSLFPKMTNSNDWIGFWGSYAGAVIGGVATMIGVSWTIHNGNCNEVKPYLIFCTVKASDIPEGKVVCGPIDAINGDNLVQIVIKIKNVGRGVAKNIVLRKEKPEKKEKVSSIIPFIEYEPGYNNEYFSLTSGFDIPKEIKPGDKEAIQKFFSQQKTSYYIITCEDLLGNVYTYKIAIEYECLLYGNQGNCEVTVKLKDWKAENV